MKTPLETVVVQAPPQIIHLAPSRGGILTRWTVDGREMLYLDEATLVDTTKNVRGGNPVLFPSPGPLVGDRFEWGGKTGAMKQHGVARNMKWDVVDVTGGSATLRAKSDDATRAQFPWDFVLTTRYSLAGKTLRVDHDVENTSAEPMPFAYGFHPYFHVRDADKARVSIPTTAKRAWDNVTKKEIAIEGPIELAKPEVDLHLVDHGKSEASLVYTDGTKLVVRGSPEYQRWVVWTLAGKDYVCLEPWTAAANAINTGASLIVVPAGGRRALFVEMEIV
jgi:galactose mutarotase-like enzyme